MRFRLLRERIAILFRPITIGQHRLHGRAAFSSTGTRPFRLGLGHARAGLCFQAGTHVNDLCILFLLIRGPTVSLAIGKNKGQGEPGKRRNGQADIGFCYLIHGFLFANKVWTPHRVDRSLKPSSAHPPAELAIGCNCDQYPLEGNLI